LSGVTFSVEVRSHDTKARVAVLSTPHGHIDTPAFMPVATRATVRTLTSEEIEAVGATIVLSNTYHLYMQPGVDTIASFGGIHSFMGWNGPVLTDSGGYQVFSMGYLKRVSEEGVLFRSHIDGSEHKLTPELSIICQQKIGADIILSFDECVAYGEPEARVRSAMERTHRWTRRCLTAHHGISNQALFGVVQGGTFPALREESARFFGALDMDGYSIGGLAVGEPKALMYSVTDETCAILPDGKPRHLLGVGSPEDLVECVARGIDLFDCALPTRIARNGALLTHGGRVDITKTDYEKVERSVEESCDCYTCHRFSAAYLHHLFKAKELLGLRLATIHNLRFVLRMMEEMRQAIRMGAFDDYRRKFLAGYKPSDEQRRTQQKSKWLRKRGILQGMDEE
jgi:queuine tRNA-ribosyltransferase